MAKMIDLAIIGSGPAAMSAAIYAAREHLATVVYERKTIGGLLAEIDRIENFPGFEGGAGADLVAVMRAQAEGFGAKIEYGEVTGIKVKANRVFELMVDEMAVVARAVLLATGSEPAKLGIEGEDLRGVSSCATCDGPFFEGETVAVIGGANSAVQEALFLLKFVRKVVLISHSPVKASEALKAKLATAEQAGKVEVLVAEPRQIMGENGRAVGVMIEDGNGAREVKVKGVFVFVGSRPATSFLAGLPVELSEKGAVVTDEQMMSGVGGLFAAGSVRDGAVNQVITAAGEGAAAAVFARKYLGK
jgi:thioredoxin reductase (NADPH)